jgi:hypothetical protein
MKNNLSYFVAAITCLALAMLACQAVNSLVGSGNSTSGDNSNTGGTSNGGSSDTAVPTDSGSSNNSGSSNGSGNTSGTSGNVLYQDDFSNDNSGWGIGSDSSSSVEYSNNTLEFKVFESNYIVFSRASDKNYQDVHLEVTTAPNNTDKNSAFGVLCDEQITEEAFYYAAVTPGGQYAIVKKQLAQDDVFLTGGSNWKTSKLIPANSPSYTIGFDCGSHGKLTLYVNGKQIDSVTDTTYTDGYIGLFALGDKKSNSADVNFTNFVATSLK